MSRKQKAGSIDKKGRPVSMLSQFERRELIEALLGVWEAHPRWGIGQLVHKVAMIHAGCRTDIERVTDAQFSVGLSAMVPDDWEVEEQSAHPAAPVRL